MKNKILITEASSLTSREMLTVLKNSSYDIDILSSNSFDISRFTSITKHRFQMENPNNYHDYFYKLNEICKKNNYFAVLSGHEEIWMFSAGDKYIQHLPLIYSSISSFDQVQGKIDFAVLCDSLNIQQPCWIRGDKLTDDIPFIGWMKSNYGTAGRGVYKVNSCEDIKKGYDFFQMEKEDLMYQEHIQGEYGQVQAISLNGKLVAVHSSIKTAEGYGGSAAARLSIDTTPLLESVTRICSYLNWQGGITFDFIRKDDQYYFIECNPRMVEPGNAAKSGINFPEIIISIITGTYNKKDIQIGKVGVKTHSTLAIMLGTAYNTKKRIPIISVLFNSLFHRGRFKGSTEVLTPIKNDLKSILPIVVTLVKLLCNPNTADTVSGSAVSNYSISLDTINNLRKENSKSN